MKTDEMFCVHTLQRLSGGIIALILRLTCSPAVRLDIEAAIVPSPANCCCLGGFRRVLLCFVKFLQT